MRGQAILIHFLRLKYFKNYLKYEKFENIKNFILIFKKIERNINFCLKKYFFSFIFFKFLITCVQIASFATKMTEKHFTKVAKSGKIKNVACWFTVCVWGGECWCGKQYSEGRGGGELYVYALKNWGDSFIAKAT